MVECVVTCEVTCVITCDIMSYGVFKFRCEVLHSLWIKSYWFVMVSVV